MDDPANFRQQMGYVAEMFAAVEPSDISQLRASGRPPVWVTFDDGSPSVVERAMEVLDDYQIRATIFVCPAVIDTSEPFWWQVVEAASDACVSFEGTPDVSTELSRLKALPDFERRRQVETIRKAVMQQTGSPLTRRQMTTAELRQWVAGGHTVGNHTWDHPLLDKADVVEQRRQIDEAHDWLVNTLDVSTFLFAYPNGNHTSDVEARLAQLGYSAGLLFDHRIDRGRNHLAMSRIRVNSTDPMPEFKARVTGIHPALHHVLGRT